MRKVDDCLDLREVNRTLNWVEEALWDLYKLARRLIKGKILLRDDGCEEVRDYFYAVGIDK